MSAQPYSRPPENPDRRPLPHGWSTQYDPSYHAWYYVDTTKSPTQSQWHHPLDRPSVANQQQNFSPPPNPPPRSSYASYQPGPGGYSQGTPYVEPERGYQQQPPPPQPQYAPPPGYEGFGRNQGWQPGWQQQQQQPQPVYVSPPAQQMVQQPTSANVGRHHHGRGGGALGGMGGTLLAGGVGLAGGALLAEAFEGHERHERREEEQAYDQGYIDAQIQDGEFSPDREFW